MFKPVNDTVVLKKTTEEPASSSGIITDSGTKTIYTVVETNDHTKELLNKKVFLKEMPVPLEENYYATDYKNILAYASD